MLNSGDVLLVAHRRLFPEDQPRFFTGITDSCEGGVVMASGHSWVRSPFSGDYECSRDRRTKVFSLTAGSLIVYRLPADCSFAGFELVQSGDHGLVLRDGAGFEMELTERCHAVGAGEHEVERRAS